MEAGAELGSSRPSPGRARTGVRCQRARILQGRVSEEGVRSAPQLFVGMDVANAQRDVALRPTGERWAVANAEPDPTLTPARYIQGLIIGKMVTYRIFDERACM